MQRRLLAGLLWALCLSLPVFGQDTTIVSGQVKDSTGAVVVGAQVTAVNLGTNLESATTTNEEGMYRIPALRPGIYRITVSASGFKRFVRDNVELRVGAVTPVNAELAIGAVTDTVEVTASAPLLETETSATGTVVDGDFFYRMPLHQRYAKGILTMTPGVTVQGFGYSGFMGAFRINGESSNRIGFFEDGAYGVSPNSNGWTTEPIQNTIEEIKVLTTALPAEYGHSAGGAITVVKKTGTNELHGIASQFGRMGGMQHRRFFQLYKLSQPRPELGLPKGDTLIFQLPDGNISGPVYIPKIYNGRNKTFFMYAVQRLIEKQGRQTLYDVPTEEEKNGIFTYPGAGVNPNPIFDPRTTRQLANGNWARDPFPGNIIPRNQFDPAMLKFLALSPWASPNVPGNPSPTGPSGNFNASAGVRTFFENHSVRLDHQVNSKFKTFANWTYNSQFGRTPNAQIQYQQLDGSLNKNMNYQNTAGLGGTYIISPTLISETRFSYYRFQNRVSSIAYGTNWGQLLGIPNIGTTSLPDGLPIEIDNPSNNVQETFNFREDVSKMMGKHAFKMGYDLLRSRGNQYSITNDGGDFNFTGCQGLNANGTNVPNTGNDWCTRWIGAVSSYSVSVNLLNNLPRSWNHGLYFQDDWKILPNLTANLGVRWMLESPANNKYGQQSSFDPTLPDNTAAGFMGVVTHPKGLMYKRDWNNFQPRVGLAWQPGKNVVVRTGFALSTVDIRLQNPPTTEFGTLTLTQNRPAGDFRPMYQLSQGPNVPFVFPTVRPDGSIPFSGSNYSSRNVTMVNSNRVNPYSMNWNFGIQYGLSDRYVVELTYTGNRSVQGTESWEMNKRSYDWAWNLLQTNPAEFARVEGNPQNYRPFPNFGNITFQGQGANSVYHAGTVKIEKRYSYGLTFMSYYTFSKSIDSSTDNIHLDRGMDRARSSFDRTHQFNGSMNYELPIGKGRKFMNRGGVLNVLFGGYDMVWMYRITSGNPVTFTFTGQPSNIRYMPTSLVAVRTNNNNRPNSTGESALLRDGWADLGGDRFTQANQNRLITSPDYFAYPAAYTMGNVGRNTMDAQRFISANFSAAKEIKLKERLTLQFRYDFQNPFKWYNLPTPATQLNYNNNHLTFGKIPANSSNEASTADGGGVPLQNITLALRW